MIPPKNYQNSSVNYAELQETKLVYRNQLYLYIVTPNYQKEKLKKTISFANHIKMNKSKKVKDMHLKNYKTLMN